MPAERLISPLRSLLRKLRRTFADGPPTEGGCLPFGQISSFLAFVPLQTQNCVMWIFQKYVNSKTTGYNLKYHILGSPPFQD